MKRLQKALMGVPWRLFALLSCGCLVVALGCSNKGRQQRPQPSAPALVKTAPRISLHGSGPLPEELSGLPAWREASSGEPMALSALGREEGAAALIQRVEVGGRPGALALDAFVHAPDARASLGGLCALLPRLAEPDRRRALRTLSEVAQLEPFGEAIDPAGDRRCAATLDDLGKQGLSPAEQDLANAIAQRL